MFCLLVKQTCSNVYVNVLIHLIHATGIDLHQYSPTQSIMYKIRHNIIDIDINPNQYLPNCCETRSNYPYKFSQTNIHLPQLLQIGLRFLFQNNSVVEQDSSIMNTSPTNWKSSKVPGRVLI